jgi:CheY-like chemotaxis protein
MTKPLALVVEDEWLLLTVVEEELVEAGFEVSSAASGAEAMIKLDEAGEDLCCLLTDIRLIGDMDGWEVARRARMLHPNLPVIYMTGDSVAKWAANGVQDSIMLPKPFPLSDLIRALKGSVW